MAQCSTKVLDAGRRLEHVDRPSSRTPTGARTRALGSYGVDRQAIVSVLGGVLGGLAGAAFVLLVTQKEAALSREAVAQLRAEMQTRLAAVDRSLDAAEPGSVGADPLAPRVRVLPPAPASVGDPPLPAGSDELRIDSPVFEAAVLDIIERADDARDAERAVVRDEVRRRRDKYWTDELTMRLGLTPAQTERLSAIQAQLTKDLDRVRSETADGRALRESRRAARHAVRQRADEQLRGVFTRQQVAAYEALDDKLKLYRQRDGD
jgi:hypothetical protein